MAALFDRFRSKKKSEYGTWVDDLALDNCMICDTPFSVIVRKHHCRLCGICVCGACSENTTFLESSRSGQAKRICDWCHYLDRVYDEEEPTYKPGDERDPKKPHVMQQPRVTRSVATRTIKEVALAGRWKVLSFFHYWSGPLEGSSRAEGKEGAEDTVQVFRSESFLDLGQKGRAIRGVLPVLPSVAEDGEVRGSAERKSGKVRLRAVFSAATGVLEGKAERVAVEYEGWVDEGGRFVGVFFGRKATPDDGKTTPGVGDDLGASEIAQRGGLSSGRLDADFPPIFGTFIATPDGHVESAVDLSDVSAAEAKWGERAKGDDSDEEVSAPRRAKGGGGKGGGETEKKSTAIVSPASSVPRKEAIRALTKVRFEGTWVFTMSFKMVDIGAQRTDAVVAGVNVGSFRPAAGGRGRGKRGGRAGGGGGDRPSGVRVGSKLSVFIDLAHKGKAYFRGSCADMGQFGKDGTVTGSMQRATGKVAMQVQMKNYGVTTSFSFNGVVNKKGHFVGAFNGCEISKDAGSVAGTFVAQSEDAESEEEEEEEEEGAGEGEDDDDDADDDEA